MKRPGFEVEQTWEAGDPAGSLLVHLAGHGFRVELIGRGRGPFAERRPGRGAAPLPRG
jgi:hypothetical protein